MASITPVNLSRRGRELTVRTAEAADAEALLSLHRSTAAESEFLSRYPDEIRTTEEKYASTLQQKRESECDLFLLAELDGCCVGMATLTGSTSRRFAHEATLAIAVSSDVWGRGIGGVLMQALLSWADGRGLVRIALEVVASNVRAVRLYESFGFVVEGTLRARRKHGDSYVDNLAMARVRLPS